jgi:protein-S-isoprenylcysteine O-methyltransferase Ste14
MGKHFTSELTVLKGHKLITSGPYSYVRHPSYAGYHISVAGIVIWYTAQGSWLRESEIYKKPLAWLVIAPVMAYILMVSLMMFRRMRKEDEMLKKGFGEAWDKWARQVPNQLFPGIY